MTSPVPRILYTEDHADTREMVAYILTENNCNVMLTESNDQALHLAQTNHFDLYIIANWALGGSGITLCKQLRALDTTTPILFYSAAAYDSDRQEAFASGAQAYLVKPVDNDKLVEAVFRLIAEAATEHQNSERVSTFPYVESQSG